MMEFIMVYTVIGMMMVFIIGSIGIVESNNPVKMIQNAETGFIMVDEVNVHNMKVDLVKLKQR